MKNNQKPNGESKIDINLGEEDFSVMQQQRLEESNTDRAIGFNDTSLFLLRSGSRLAVFIASIIAFTFFLYLVYVVAPDVKPPLELENFLAMVWNILSNGVVVAALTMILPALFKRAKQKPEDDEAEI